MIPGVSSNVAVLIGDGSGQHVGSICFSAFVYVNGNKAVFSNLDLNEILGYISSPYNGVNGIANRNFTNTLEVLGSVFSCFLISGLNVCDRIVQAVFSRLGYFGDIGSGGFVAACEYSNAHCQKQEASNQSFHDKLLLIS